MQRGDSNKQKTKCKKKNKPKERKRKGKSKRHKTRKHKSKQTTQNAPKEMVSRKRTAKKQKRKQRANRKASKTKPKKEKRKHSQKHSRQPTNGKGNANGNAESSIPFAKDQFRIRIGSAAVRFGSDSRRTSQRSRPPLCARVPTHQPTDRPADRSTVRPFSWLSRAMDWPTGRLVSRSAGDGGSHLCLCR